MLSKMRLRSSRRKSRNADKDDRHKKQTRHKSTAPKNSRKEFHKNKKSKRKTSHSETSTMNVFKDSSYKQSGARKSPPRDTSSLKKNTENSKQPVTIEIISLDTDDENSMKNQSPVKDRIDVTNELKKKSNENNFEKRISIDKQGDEKIICFPDKPVKENSSQLKHEVTPEVKQLSFRDAKESEITSSQNKQHKSKRSKIDPTSSRCWSCMVSLDKEALNDPCFAEGTDMLPRPFWESTFLYSIHGHPSLHIMCCSPCADRAEHIESLVLLKEESKNLKSADDDTVEEQTCSLCAGESAFDANYDYNEKEVNKYLKGDLMCDFCPRIFCVVCLSRILGGGKTGWKSVMKILNEDKPWKCIRCAPPPFLTAMKMHLINKADTKDDVQETSSSHIDTESQLNQLIQDLTNVEDAKEYACSMLENDIKEKITSELMSQINIERRFSNESIDREVNDTYDEWSKEWEDHCLRLEDTIVNLQEHMEVLGLNLDAFYKCRNSDRSSEDNHDSDPDWKRQADDELDKRDIQNGLSKGAFRGASGYTPQDPEIMYRDLDELSEGDLLEIEDINSTAESTKQLEAIAKAQANPWRSGNCIPEKDILRLHSRALAADNRELQSLNVSPNHLESKSLSERDDFRKEMKLWRKDSERGLGKNMTGSRIVLRAIADLEHKCRHRSKNRKKNSSSLRRDSEGKKRELTTRSLDPHETKKRIIPDLIGASNGDTGKNHEVSMPVFSHSDLTLQSFQVPKSDNNNEQQIKSISITTHLSSKLKQHQKEGIKFMWDLVFGDLVQKTSDTERLSKIDNASCTENEIKGCILAHNMGLGKSLQVISLIHTLYSHPMFVSKQPPKGYTITDEISRILLVVPVNTISNWINEFKIWCKDLNLSPIKCYNLNDTYSNSMARGIMIQNWIRNGGVLLSSSDTLARICKPCLSDKDSNASPSNSSHNDAVKALWKEAFIYPGPCAVVLDEAHTMLKSNKTDIFKTLSSLPTKRRIALTGTPMQNNLIEYYHMASWVKPGCLGKEQEFERKFVTPIMNGLVADCELSVLRHSEQLSIELTQQLSSFVQRKDNSVLLKVLPPLQQAVIHVHKTKMQAKLYNAFKRYRKRTCNNNFFDQYHKLRPVNNHPGCLLERAVVENDKACNGNASTEIKSKENITTSDEEIWWDQVFKKNPNMDDVKNGSKVVLLLHILAHADLIGDKVVVFSQCLKTLDYIEKILNKSGWEKLVPSLKSLSPGKMWGPWRRNTEYLRIDGSTNANERGELVKNFNDKFDICVDNESTFERTKIENSKVFLISSKAGGMGINLVAANRIVLFDSHWNPAIDLQALYRCYRYGQTKHVFAYRLLAEGTMEEKVYSRSVNKSGLAARIVDSRFPERNFTADELKNLLHIDEWLCCDDCDKWRMMPPGVDIENLKDDYWNCSMNIHDPPRSKCSAKERDQQWYIRHYTELKLAEHSSIVQESIARDSIESVPADDPQKRSLTEQDIILQHLLQLQENKTPKSLHYGELGERSSSTLISKYNFHECLMRDAEKSKEENDKKTQDELPVESSSKHKKGKSSQEKAKDILNKETRKERTRHKKSAKMNNDTKAKVVSESSSIDVNEKAKQAFLSGRTGKTKKVKIEVTEEKKTFKEKTPERKKTSPRRSEPVIITID